MRLLVLGGTGFVGRHIVGCALARGDEVTLFNRGISAPALVAQAQLLRGDRAGDLSARCRHASRPSARGAGRCWPKAARGMPQST